MVNDLYQEAVIRILAIVYLILGKKTKHPSIQKFDLEHTEKLVAIITASKMIREYLIKQKILMENINPILPGLLKTCWTWGGGGGGAANLLVFNCRSIKFGR